MLECRQDPVPQSDYHARLEADGDLVDEDGDEDDSQPSNVRYWSDYSRVYFHPRTLQRLPDPADWEASEGDWIKSKETFLEHENVRRIWVNVADVT